MLRKIQSLFNKRLWKKKSVKDFSALAGSNILLRPISLVKSFLVAKYLGPADYGILKSTELISMLNKFGNLGFRNVAIREVGVLQGKDQEHLEKQIRDTAYSSEVILAILLALAGIIAGIILSSKWIWIIGLASLGLLANKIRAIYNTEAVIQKKFTLIAKVTFFTGLFVAVFVAATVPFLRIYAALAVPVLVSGGAIVFYRKKLTTSFSFNISKPELRRQLKIGIPLTLDTLSFGSYIYLERILIIKFLGFTALGFFGFATMIANQFVNIFLSAVRVRTMKIYELLGKGQFKEVNKLVIRETAVLLLGAIAIVPLTWVLLHYLVPVFLEKYNAAILIASIFIFVVPLKVVGSYLTLILKAPTVNKQSIMPYVLVAASGVLFGITITLKLTGQLTLRSFVIADLIGYAFMHSSYVLFYYLFFYRKYCR